MREPRPVIRAEVTEKNKTLRIIAAAVLLVVGIIALTSGFMKLLGKEPGWQEIQIKSDVRNCSGEFALQYYFSDASATAVSNRLQITYEDACVKAYQLFTPDEAIAGVNNIHYINHHPNEVIAVDPVLYAAFEKMAGTPYLYMGPVYAHYYSIIFNAPDEGIAQLDPLTSQEAKAYIDQIMAFASDDESVKLELLGGNQVKLNVSEAYLQFAAEEEIDRFLDFAYLTNAFIIDYLADRLTADGLTDGYLVSADGYTRNLSNTSSFNFNIFDRVGNTIYPAGVMEYQGPISIVYFKDYSVGNTDVNYRDNLDHVVHLFADPVDGIYRTATEELVSYSYEEGCADVALKMLPTFLGEGFAVPQGVYSIWCEGGMICYNDETVTIGQFMKGKDFIYRAELKK